MRRASAAVGLAVALASAGARADPPGLHATYNLDVAVVDHHAAQVLDKLLVSAAGDFASGLQLYGSVLNVSGDQPNLHAGALQGIDNIEAEHHRLRLYEAWFDKELPGGASLRVGVQDYNREFYATDSTDLLNSPTFGIGEEVGASGVSGPSIFPRPGLAARLAFHPSDVTFVQAAVLNGHAGSFSLDEGLLLAFEAGWTGRGRVAVGAWRYTRRQPVSPPGPDPDERAIQQGAYLLVEEPFPGKSGPFTGFLRAGISDPAGLPLAASVQAGVNLAPVFATRPDSRLTIGLAAARPSERTRRDVSASGERPATSELLLEATYADRVAPHLTLQPDLQFIRDAGARRGRDRAVVILRMTLDY